jgi:regulatory protein
MTSSKSMEELFACAYRMLSIKSRTRRQVYDALLKVGATADSAAIVADELTERGLLDDSAFVRRFIDVQLERKPCGRRFMLAALLRAGVEYSTALPPLHEVFTHEKEMELAALLVSRLKSKSNRDPVQILRHLKRRGFNDSACLSVMEEEFDGCLDITH